MRRQSIDTVFLVRKLATTSVSGFLFLLMALVMSLTPPLAAQKAESDSVFTKVNDLRGKGNFGQAAQLLRDYLGQHPADPTAEALLSETLYWAKDITAARAEYENAIRLHPDDPNLRLGYGRMLVDTRDDKRAKQVLNPLLGNPGFAARTETLFGTLAYWEGDLTTAAHGFRNALAKDPALPDAARQLAEIEDISRPSLGLTFHGNHDDQPLSSVSARLDVGYFLTPLTAITAGVQKARYYLPGEKTRDFFTGEIGTNAFAAALQMETSISGGVIQRSNGTTSDWTGHGLIRFRLPQQVALAFSFDRSAYLYTLASVSTPVMPTTARGTIALNRTNGWLGESAFEYQRYQDANAVKTGYAWLLAPLVHDNIGELGAGYAISYQTSARSQFVLANINQPYPPTDARFSTAGIYVPYYTPANTIVHSVAASGAIRASSGTVFRANGSFGFHGSQDRPAFTVVTSNGIASPVRSFQSTSFNPWNGRIGVESPSRGSMQLRAWAETMKTAFYRTSSFGLTGTYKFGRASTGSSSRRDAMPVAK